MACPWQNRHVFYCTAFLLIACSVLLFRRSDFPDDGRSKICIDTMTGYPCEYEKALARFVTDQIRHASNIVELIESCGQPSLAITCSSSRETIQASQEFAEDHDEVMDELVYTLGSLAEQTFGSVFVRTATTVLQSFAGRGRTISQFRISVDSLKEIQKLRHILTHNSNVPGDKRRAITREIKAVLSAVPVQLIEEMQGLLSRIEMPAFDDLVRALEELANTGGGIISHLDQESERISSALKEVPRYHFWAIYRFLFRHAPSVRIQNRLHLLRKWEPFLRSKATGVQAIYNNLFVFRDYMVWYNSTTSHYVSHYYSANLQSVEEEIADADLALNQLIDHADLAHEREEAIGDPPFRCIELIKEPHLVSRVRRPYIASGRE